MSWRDGRPLRIAFLAVLLWALGQCPLGVSVAAADEPDEQLVPSYEPATQPSVVKPGSSSADRRPPIVRKPAKAPDEHEEHVEHEPHPKNNIGLGFAYSAQWLTETEGHGANKLQNLYGFSLFYERVLIPGHLALSVRKPFLFDGERFDSGLSTVLEGLLQRKHWELFLGVGVMLNLRVFEVEQEGEPEGLKVSLGVPVITGVNLLLTHHWSLQVEGSYIWIATDDPVKHELETFLTALYHF
jgi:hypothetical protein